MKTGGPGSECFMRPYSVDSLPMTRLMPNGRSDWLTFHSKLSLATFYNV